MNHSFYPGAIQIWYFTGGIIVLSFLISSIFTLIFEIPFISLSKLLLKQKPSIYEQKEIRLEEETQYGINRESLISVESEENN